MTQLARLEKRDVPVEWRADLSQIGGVPSNEFAWLEIVWEPGHPWEPVDRWFIYQMTPAHTIDADLLAELNGPRPDDINHYDTVLKKNVVDTLVTQRAWDLYRSSRDRGLPAFGRPFWVIQGTKGGHRRWFTTVEQKLLKLKGLAIDPPVPGSQPYAPYDNRVKEQLVQHSVMKAVHDRFAELKKRSPAEYAAHKDELEREFRIELLKWLKPQLDDAAQDVTKALFDSDAPRHHDAPDYERLAEEAEQNFIETGNTAGIARGLLSQHQ